MAIELADLTKYGVNVVSATAGFFGALIAALRAEVEHRAERVLYFFVGFIFAIWVPPLILKLANLPQDPSMLGGLAFVGGYFAMSLLDILSAAFKGAKSVNYKSVIEGWLKKDNWFKKKESSEKKES